MGGAGACKLFTCALYSGIYAIEWRGAFLWRVYRADFTGVNGGFFKNVYKST